MKSTTRESVTIFAKHAWKYKHQVIAMFVGITLIVILSALQPYILKRLVDSAYSSDLSAKEGMMLLVYFLTGTNLTIQLFWRILGFINNDFQPKVMVDLTRSSFKYLIGHSQGFFSNNYVGGIVAKLKRFPSSFERIADVISWSFIPTSLTLIVLTGIITYNWPLVGVVIILWAVVYVVFAYRYSLFKLPYDKRTAMQDTVATAYAADVISNNSNVHDFAGRQFETRCFNEVTELLRILRKKSWDLTTYGEIFQNITTASLIFACMSVGVYYHKRGLFSGSEFVMLYLYLRELSHHLWEIGRHIRTLYGALADADEMTVMLTTPHEIVDSKTTRDFLVRKGSIAFENVTYAYPNQPPVIKNFSLYIKEKEKVALVGESGAGKSSLIKLALRHMDIQEGGILLDNMDIRNMTQDSLHNNISHVSQNPDLFGRTLLENIRYNRQDSSFDEVVEAAKAAQCHDFIMKMPEGYDTLVGERGIKLSGGQRQRVAIARALVRNSPILILDEATSSLDSESEKLFQLALRPLIKGRTVIVVAHRLSTIKEMDRIIVIREGSVSEEGTHDELLALGGEYARYWKIQSGGFITAAEATA